MRLLLCLRQWELLLWQGIVFNHNGSGLLYKLRQLLRLLGRHHLWLLLLLLLLLLRLGELVDGAK